MAIIIAILSIANTISLSIHERTRELGLLRAVGQQRRQLRSMVRREAVIVSLFGTIGGIAIGTFLSWALVRVVADSEGFGTWDVPAGQFAVILGLGALAGVLAAARPGRRAAKLPVLTAISS
jgi:putative ABC transport system permease protein